MKISVGSKLIFAGISCFCFFISFNLNAQTETVQPKYKQVFVYIPKKKAEKIPQVNNKAIIDSLKLVLYETDSLYHAALSSGKIKDSIADELNQRLLKQVSPLASLQSEVSKYKAMNEQTAKNNFILFVFNSVVSLLLLLMLVRYLLVKRKRKNHLPEKRTVVLSENKSKTDLPKEETKIVYTIEQLDKLEKLGRLRNSGILTEDEFMMQKQMVLKN